MHFVIVSVNAHKNSYKMDGIAVTTGSAQANEQRITAVNHTRTLENSYSSLWMEYRTCRK